jgi:hypothetical protein
MPGNAYSLLVLDCSAAPSASESTRGKLQTVPRGSVLTCWRVPPGSNLEISIDSELKFFPVKPGERVSLSDGDGMAQIYMRWTQITVQSDSPNRDKHALLIAGDAAMAFDAQPDLSQLPGAALEVTLSGAEQLFSATSIPCNGCTVSTSESTGTVVVLWSGRQYKLNLSGAGLLESISLPVRDVREVTVQRTSGAGGKAILTYEVR